MSVPIEMTRNFRYPSGKDKFRHGEISYTEWLNHYELDGIDTDHKKAIRDLAKQYRKQYEESTS